MLRGKAASRVGALLREDEAGGWLRSAHAALGEALERGNGRGGARREEAGEG